MEHYMKIGPMLIPIKAAISYSRPEIEFLHFDVQTALLSDSDIDNELIDEDELF